MADATTTLDGPARVGDAATRQVRRRRSLPGGRAVVGALLVTAAAVGVFAAYLNATAAPTASWVVATTDLPRGTVLEPGMLDAVAMEVPAGQQPALVAADAIPQLVGRTTLGPVRTGDLLQWTSVLAVPAPTQATTFTFALPGPRVAYRGDLAAGDTIDLVATYGQTTTYVARDIELLLTPAGSEAGTSLTVAVKDPTTVLAIANALDAAQVFVLRSPADGIATVPPPLTPLTVPAPSAPPSAAPSASSPSSPSAPPAPTAITPAAQP